MRMAFEPARSAIPSTPHRRERQQVIREFANSRTFAKRLFGQEKIQAISMSWARFAKIRENLAFRSMAPATGRRQNAGKALRTGVDLESALRIFRAPSAGLFGPPCSFLLPHLFASPGPASPTPVQS